MKKNKIYQLLTGFILFALLITGIPAHAEEIITAQNGYSEDGLWLYNDYGDGTISVTCQDNTITEAEIPAEIDGHIITMVELDCFKDNTSLKKVILPSTITVIEDYAFYKCFGLESINIPENVEKIGFQAFYGCNLSEVTIPASVTEIEGWAFEGCNSLKAVHVAKGNQNYVDEEGILFNIDKTELILYPSAKPDTSYTVPETCVKLESYAFMANQFLQEININSVQEMGEDIFYYCTSLESMTIPEGITELKGSMFGNCTSLKTVILPEGITSLGSGCFYNCISLEELQLPDSLTSMSDYVFFNCASLKSLTVSENVKSIGKYAMGWYYGEDSSTNENQEDSYKLLPNFEIDTNNGTKAFEYAAENNIKCTGGITQGIVFVYIMIGIVILVILAVIGLIIMQKRYQKQHELF